MLRREEKQQPKKKKEKWRQTSQEAEIAAKTANGNRRASDRHCKKWCIRGERNASCEDSEEKNKSTVGYNLRTPLGNMHHFIQKTKIKQTNKKNTYLRETCFYLNAKKRNYSNRASSSHENFNRLPPCWYSTKSKRERVFCGELKRQWEKRVCPQLSMTEYASAS